MPVFGEYETNDEPLAVTPTRNQTTTVWLARKSGAQDGRQFAVKCLAIHRDERTHVSDEALGADPGLEFIETVKQLKKAQSEGSRDFLPILAFGTSDHGSWYATEFCARGSLKTWINLRGGMDSAALRQVVSSIAQGCKSLKRICGRSHGNLKPSNVLLHGKSRPLKSTPLLMVDPVPVSTSRVSELGADNRKMVQNIFEAQDLRAIGELILQLVEGRLIESGSDYNFPVESSPGWQKLGRDEAKWRGLCNRLIDPQLDLEKTNLDWLAKNYSAGISAQVILIPVAAAVVLAVVGGSIYLYAAGGFQRHVRAADTARDDGDWIVAAEEIQKALKMRPNDPEATKLSQQILGNLVQAARKEVAVGNWNTAEKEIDAAKTLNPGDADLVSVDQRLQHGKAYDAAMSAGQQAFENKNYDEAIRQAHVALENSPKDKAAEDLQADCANAKGAVDMQASGAREHGYELAIKAVRDALGAGKYDEAIRQAVTAQDYKPGDAEATRLKTEAQNARDAAASKMVAARQAYDAAMQAGRHALEKNNYTEAIKQANVALQNEPGDADASQLAVKAANQQQAAAEAQGRQQQYQAALSAGQTALSGGNYDEAVRQAKIALSIKPGDADATKLQSDAQTQAQAAAQAQVRRQKYDAAIAAGQHALSNNQYDEAIRQADIALANEPGDSAAAQLKSDAQGQAKAAADALAHQRAYETAMAAARAALQKNDYNTAIAQARVALENEPGDDKAKQLESDADARAKAAADAAARKKNYDAAMAAGLAAYSKGQYDEAINQANTALVNAPDDSQAAKLRNDAQTQLNYAHAISAGNAALSAGRFTEASQQAKIALDAKPGDAQAMKLQDDASTGKFNSFIAAGNADLSKGNFKEALQYAQAALKIKDDPAAQAIETQAASIEKTQADLDGKLAILMKDFGVDQQSGSKILPNPKATKITEIDDPRYVTQYLLLTTNLEAAYLKEGWLDLEKRRDILQHVRKNLNNY
ncbi:MAG TPA: tetratricopeptide repeat protein [Verrucomicrobiae bacterium]|jgi:colicin import membrane protein|nr:tetratricopeptide repeat protein [Verrucomicrobiae bacterium]